MTRGTLANPAASIRQRLLNHARETGDDFQRILTRYAIERLLFRISRSAVRDQYVLKGAMLFVTWPEHALRPTGDLDLLGFGDPSPAVIKALFTEICAIEEPDDGIVFDLASLRVESAREEDQYQGAKLKVVGHLSRARATVQVDIGFGDHVHPEALRGVFPNLLDGPPRAEIKMYPAETVVAEKLEAMIRFGEATGRLKDFHDIWVTTRTFRLQLADVVEAVRGTLKRRGTAIPANLPPTLLPAFADRRETQGLWAGFLRRSPPNLPPPRFNELLGELRQFFGPVLGALASPDAQVGVWNPDARRWEQP